MNFRELIFFVYNFRLVLNYKVMFFFVVIGGKVVLVGLKELLFLNVCIRKRLRVSLDNFRYFNYNFFIVFNVMFNSGEWMGRYYV